VWALHSARRKGCWVRRHRPGAAVDVAGIESERTKLNSHRRLHVSVPEIALVGRKSLEVEESKSGIALRTWK
jgi:hypothetical protein